MGPPLVSLQDDWKDPAKVQDTAEKVLDADGTVSCPNDCPNRHTPTHLTARPSILLAALRELHATMARRHQFHCGVCGKGKTEQGR